MKHKQYKAAKLVIDPNIKNFYDFTVDSFKLVDYKYNDKKYKIETNFFHGSIGDGFFIPAFSSDAFTAV